MRRVVITGLGAVSPLGNNVADYWRGLKDGKCGIDFITRYDTSDCKVKIAAEVRGFNPLEFMDKGEARRTDLFSQYALAVSVQAMADSGLSDIDPQRLGVYFSSGIGGLLTFDAESRKLHTGGESRISPYFIAMMIENMAAGLIAIRHKAEGPSLSVVTACASSTNTVGEAFRAIKHGYADAVIAGGSEATVHPLAIGGFTNSMALSQKNVPDDTSTPFDLRRDGFVMGEGAGALILEEYERAKRRGAKIYAEIKGYGNTCDAHHVTAPRPDGKGAERAISDALKEAGIAGDNLYINAHGTGTPLNDKSETAAIKQALGEKAASCLVSSTKSMIGHCLGAAGALEAIAAVMALKEGIIPPTIGYKQPDPECDLDYVPNKARNKQVDAALSTSMGFGGHNACVAFARGEKNES